MGLIDLFLRHLLDHLFLRDGRIGITSDRGKDIPHISPDQVRFGHAPTDFVIPSNSRLRPWMPFQRRAQIPFKRADIVALDAQTRGVHHTNQFFGFRISGSRRWQQFLHCVGVSSLIHEVSGGFDLSNGRAGNQQGQAKGKAFHIISSVLALAGAPAYASGLPEPLQPSDFHPVDEKQAQLGQLLFFDPILSGNQNISCATCHNPDHGGADALSLGIGEGGDGVGPDRTAGQGADRIKKRIPRNAPALWNLGAKEIDTMFYDGRVSHSDIYENGFDTPAQEWLPEGLSGILAVQALFPMTSQFEMAGDPSENQIAGAVYDRVDYVWPIVAKRVRIIPEYATLFQNAFDDVNSPLDITITHITNAISAFENFEFRSYDSPFDSFLGGDTFALNDMQTAGLELFYGKAGCSMCHSGPLLTDQDFYALMLPHFGPGRTRQWDTIVRDVGRMTASDRLEDAYRFRTPSLRNVALTGPYGHNGAYPTLEGIVRHHLDPEESFANWTPELADLPSAEWLEAADFLSFQDKFERQRLASRSDIEPVVLSDKEVDQIVAFLHSLTGTQSVKGRLGRPASVPSGLEID